MRDISNIVIFIQILTSVSEMEKKLKSVKE
jgi:hypothetical protein